MFLRIKPFVYWFTPLVWLGYIFTIDGFVLSIKKTSLLQNKKKSLSIFLLSLLVWYLFEIVNKICKWSGWAYINLPESRLETFLMGSLSFSTIIPAIFETKDLASIIFSNLKIKIKPKWYSFILTKNFVALLLSLGIIFILLPFFIISPWLWVFVWTGFILLIDPLLYLQKNEKCILFLIKKKKWKTLLSIFFAGYICGFLWEFWNYWAYTKWVYTIPILENIKIFEIPVIGFLAYGPFALELYDFYILLRFVRFKIKKWL